MPTLKQLTCHILHGHSIVPLKEYSTTYNDGTVETFIAIPTNPANLPVPFSVHLTSNGYIAPGLAMFVFIDGVYQCNRNREDLVWDVKGEIERRVKGKDDGSKKGKGKKAAERERELVRERQREKRTRDVDFVVRQKEERRDDGSWVGRPWRFEEFRVVNSMPEIPDVDPKTHFADLGNIVVLVLRCVAKGDRPADSDSDSDAPRSAMALGFDLDDSDSGSNSEDDIVIQKSSSKGKGKASMQPTVEDDNDGNPFGGLFGIFDGDHSAYCGPQHTYYPYQGGQQQSHHQSQHYQQQPPQLQQQWNAYTQQWQTVPHQQHQTLTTQAPPHQYNPGYASQPQYVVCDPTQPSQSSHDLPSTLHNHPCRSCGNRRPHVTSSNYHRSSSKCQTCGIPNRKPRSLSQHLHSQNYSHTHAHSAPPPLPPPPQRHVHWADQQPAHTPVPLSHPQQTTATQPQVVYVTPQPFLGQQQQPVYTYVPDQGYYHNHSTGGYVIQNGQKVYSDCELCRRASEAASTSASSSAAEEKKGKGKNKKKKKGKGDKDDKDREKKVNSKGKGGKKEDKGKGTDKDEKKGEDCWGGGGGDSSWGNETTNDKNDKKDNNDNKNDNASGVTGGWDCSDGLAKAQTSPRSPTPAFSGGGDPFSASCGGDPFSQSQSRSRSRSHNHSQSHNGREPSPARYQTRNNQTQANTNANSQAIFRNQTLVEDADEFVTPLYRDPMPDSPPLYTVPEPIAKERSLTHQVQMGGSLPYVHKIRTPQYLDTMEEPYAKFVFKYRRKDVIENMFKVTVERDVEAERKVLEALPRDQIVETLLRAQGLLSNSTPVKKPPSRAASRTVSWNLAANNNSNNHNNTHANPATPSRSQTAKSPPVRKTSSNYHFTTALTDSLNALRSGGGRSASHNSPANGPASPQSEQDAVIDENGTAW